MGRNFFSSTCSVLTTGCILYEDTTNTIPVPNGFYSDGSSCYEVNSGITPFIAGEIIFAQSCVPTPTPTTSPTPTPTNTATPTPTTSPTPTPSSTPGVTPTSTPTGTPGPTPTPTGTLIEGAIIIPFFPSGFGTSSGTTFFDTRNIVQILFIVDFSVSFPWARVVLRDSTLVNPDVTGNTIDISGDQNALNTGGWGTPTTPWQSYDQVWIDVSTDNVTYIRAVHITFVVPTDYTRSDVITPANVVNAGDVMTATLQGFGVSHDVLIVGSYASSTGTSGTVLFDVINPRIGKATDIGLDGWSGGSFWTTTGNLTGNDVMSYNDNGWTYNYGAFTGVLFTTQDIRLYWDSGTGVQTQSISNTASGEYFAVALQPIPAPALTNAIVTAMAFQEFINSANTYTTLAAMFIYAAAQVSVSAGGTLFVRFVGRDSTSVHPDQVFDKSIITLTAGDNQSIGDAFDIGTKQGWYDEVVLQQSLTNLPGSYVDYVTYNFHTHVSGETQNGFYVNNGTTATSASHTVAAAFKLNPGWAANLSSWVLSSITVHLQSYKIAVGLVPTAFSGTVTPTTMTSTSQTFSGTLTSAPGAFTVGNTLQAGFYLTLTYTDDTTTTRTLDVSNQMGIQVFPAQGAPFYAMSSKFTAT